MSIESISFVQLDGGRGATRRQRAWPRVLLLVALLAVLAWSAVRAYGAWRFEQAAAAAQPLVETGTWHAADAEHAQRELQGALRFFPDHPDYLELSGQLLALQAAQPGVAGEERTALLNAAADRFRRAIQVRPLWPYGWANLLLVKSELGAVDAEFARALERAAALGPWEREVQMRVLSVSFRHWDALQPAQQQRAREILDAAYSVQPGAVLRQVGAYGRADLMCPVHGNHRLVRDYCQQALPPTGAE